MQNAVRAVKFTLIELLAGMFILSIIMLVLFEILIQAQLVMANTRVRSDLITDSRLLLEFVSRDMQCFLTDDEPGHEINWTNTSGMPTGGMIAFVSSSGLGSDISDPDTVVEVCYALVDSEIIRYWSKSGDATNWDFINQPPSTWAATWSDSSVVATGVYSAWMTLIPSTFSDTDVTPPGVRFDFRLVDKSAPTPDLAAKGARDFSKTIFMSREQ